MNKIFGILIVLIYLFVVSSLLGENFLATENLQNILRNSALLGIIGIGVAFVIMTGGIDLSIGSWIGFTGCLLAMMIAVKYTAENESEVSLSESPEHANKVLVVTTGSIDLEPGDLIAIQNMNSKGVLIHEVESADGDTIRVKEPINSTTSKGKVIEVYPLSRTDIEGKKLYLEKTPAGLKVSDKLLGFFPGTSQRGEYLVQSIGSEEGKSFISTKTAPRKPLEKDVPYAQGVVGLARSSAWHPLVAVVFILALSLVLGVTHGLLITKLNLQPFVVTLASLMLFRGLARFITGDTTQGFGTEYNDTFRQFAIGYPCSLPTILLIAGIGMVGFWVWRSRGASERSSKNRWLDHYLLIMGGLFVLIGSSRFWLGVSYQAHDPFFSIFGISIPAISATTSETAAKFPGELMWWIGILAIPSAIAFLLTTPSAGRTRSWLLVGEIGLAVGLLVGLLLWTTSNLSSEEISDSSKLTWERVRMFGVFLVAAYGFLRLGKLMTLVFASESDWHKLLFVLSGSLFILFACGKTTAIGVETAEMQWIFGRTELGMIRVPAPILTLALIGVICSILLNKTIYGRYILALGKNEHAAKYSGIKTAQMKILAYVICALCAGVAGILYALDLNSMQPSGQGNILELYAIAAAVLGGCSLRGGEGNVIGVVMGAAVMRMLYNSINILKVNPTLEMVIIGIVILVGNIVDELIRKSGRTRR